MKDKCFLEKGELYISSTVCLYSTVWEVLAERRCYRCRLLPLSLSSFLLTLSKFKHAEINKHAMGKTYKIRGKIFCV